MLREDRQYQTEMKRSFHHITGYPDKATCGWNGGWWDGISIPQLAINGTHDQAALVQMKVEQDALEAVGGQYSGRKPCKRCLAALGIT